MNFALNILNFLGVGLLVGLCAIQWKHDGELAHAKAQLEQVRTEQVTKIADQEAAIKSSAADLDDTRQHLTASEAALKDSQSKLQAMTRLRDQSESQRDQLAKENVQQRITIEKWSKVVAEREQALKQAGELAQKAQADRNEAVVKFNDLVTKYNEAIKELGAQKSHG